MRDSRVGNQSKQPNQHNSLDNQNWSSSQLLKPSPGIGQQQGMSYADSNQGPAHLQSASLTTEICAHVNDDMCAC